MPRSPHRGGVAPRGTIDEYAEAWQRGDLEAMLAFSVDGAPVIVDRALRYRVEQGRISELWLYDRQQHLVDRAWSGS